MCINKFCIMFHNYVITYQSVIKHCGVLAWVDGLVFYSKWKQKFVKISFETNVSTQPDICNVPLPPQHTRTVSCWICKYSIAFAGDCYFLEIFSAKIGYWSVLWRHKQKNSVITCEWDTKILSHSSSTTTTYCTYLCVYSLCIFCTL